MFLLNGLVFFIIGLGLPEIVTGIKSNGIPIETAIGYGIIVTIVLIVARIISSYVAMFSTIVFRPHVARNMNFNRRSFLSPLVLGWTGMRGSGFIYSVTVKRSTFSVPKLDSICNLCCHTLNISHSRSYITLHNK